MENFHAGNGLQKIIGHYFKDLIPLLSRVADPRDASYIKYEVQVPLLLRILSAVFHIGSMRKMSEQFNYNACIHNVKKLLQIEELTELPHWSTVNNLLERIDPTELEKIIPKLIYRLIRMRSFENSRIQGKYWQIAIDGTQLYTFDEKHCDHCLSAKHKDKEGNITSVTYYHRVLEAKLVVNEDIVLSIATEFIENEHPDISKQDCELKAFYRLAEKLKRNFKRLPICLTMDSLYACGPVFDLCAKNSWQYIVRFKEGSLPSVAEEFHVLKNMEDGRTHTFVENDITLSYTYVPQILYREHALNMIAYTQSDMKYPFVFLTKLPITKRNYRQLVSDGRRKWKIENQGFNIQKNHGYALQHLFSEDYQAMKNHYFLIQIGHMIFQLLEYGLSLRQALKLSLDDICLRIKLSFQTDLLTDNDIFNAERSVRIRSP